MFSIKTSFRNFCEIIAKSRGIIRLFARGEVIFFPVSVGVIGVVAGHSLLVLLMSLLGRMGIDIAIPAVLPLWFVAVFVCGGDWISDELYCDADAVLSGVRDGNCGDDGEALSKNWILAFMKFGFGPKGMVHKDKGKMKGVEFIKQLVVEHIDSNKFYH